MATTFDLAKFNLRMTFKPLVRGTKYTVRLKGRVNDLADWIKEKGVEGKSNNQVAEALDKILKEKEFIGAQKEINEKTHLAQLNFQTEFHTVRLKQISD